MNTDPANDGNSDEKFTVAPAPNTTTVYNYVKTYRARVFCSTQEEKHSEEMLTEGKLGGFGARLEMSPRKSLDFVENGRVYYQH
jgi:hypothetical protein